MRLLLLSIFCLVANLFYAELESLGQNIIKEQKEEITKPSFHNEEVLTEQLKGQTKEEVVKVLGEPAVKKPSEESEENSGYWWYNLPEAGIFVYFKDGMVYNISVLTKDKRSKEL